MGTSVGKAERTRARILEALRKDRTEHPGRCVSSVELARKLRLEYSTVTRYVREFWKEDKVLRQHLGCRRYGHRIVLEGEDIEIYRGAKVGLQAYDG